MRLALLTATFVTASNLALAGDWSGGNIVARSEDAHLAASHPGGIARYGLIGEHDIEIAGFVLGAEAEGVQRPQAHVATNGQSGVVGRLKFRAGGDFGPATAYAIVGGTSAQTSDGSEAGVVYGVGLRTTLGNTLRLSGEALHEEFEGSSATGSTLQRQGFNVRVSFRF